MVVTLLQEIRSRGTKALQTGLNESTDFIRGNPITSGAVAGGVGIFATQRIISSIRKKRKKKTTTKRRRKTTKRKTTSRVGKRRRSTKRKIIRGRGLGSHEVHHGRRKTKLVSFKTKHGKTVRFKVRGSGFKHRRGYKGKRRK